MSNILVNHIKRIFCILITAAMLYWTWILNIDLKHFMFSDLPLSWQVAIIFTYLSFCLYTVKAMSYVFASIFYKKLDETTKV